MKYDYKKAKDLIEEEKENIKEASLGMHEDWFWTAETIFADDEFKINLEEEGLTIAGIDGSAWATPVLEIEYKDGTIREIKCGVGEHTRTRPVWLGGVISDEVTNLRETFELED